jgi:hypothetical protein
MPNFALADQRSTARFKTDGLLVNVRRKGRLNRLEGLAQDFNRHGLSMIIDQPLVKESVVLVALILGDSRITNVVGVVHNCIAVEHGYRCGIQFRTGSSQQMDRQLIEQELTILERRYKTLNLFFADELIAEAADQQSKDV